MTVVSHELVLKDEAEALRMFDSDELIAFDIETTGLSWYKGDRVVVISLAAPGKPPAVLHYPSLEVPPRVIDFLERRILIGHNIINFDVPFLAQHGYDPLRARGMVDTLICEKLAIGTSRRLPATLKDTIKRRLNVEVDKDMDHAGWRKPALDENQYRYAASDVRHIHALFNEQARKIQEMGSTQTLLLEKAIAPVVASMVMNGMPLDDAERRRMLGLAATRRDDAYAALTTLLGKQINPGSPKQVKDAFRDVFELPLPGTDEQTLLQVAQHGGNAGLAAHHILEYRKAVKRFMYDDEWVLQFGDPTGRVHYQLRSQGADTGRFTSSQFNMQQIPRDMHGMFGHPEDEETVIVKADFSGIEILVSGVMMNEPDLVDAMVSGQDVHRAVAAKFYNKAEDDITKEERRIAKAGVFTFLFGGGPGAVIYAAREGGVEMSKEDATAVLTSLANQFPNITRFQNKQIIECRRHKVRRVPIPYGPSRVLTPENNRPTVYLNNLVQGTAASGMKCAIARLKNAGLAKYARVTVHDELVLECPRDVAEEVGAELEQTMKLGMKDVIGVIPGVEVQIGSHWA